jgi:multisubunit Na+/H+ antiporter MnhF subunit
MQCISLIVSISNQQRSAVVVVVVIRIIVGSSFFDRCLLVSSTKIAMMTMKQTKKNFFLSLFSDS